MSLTGTRERVTPPIPTYTLGSYRASTSITPIWPADPQQEIFELGVLRNQLAHAQSAMFVNHTLATVYDMQPNFVTLVVPGREYFPNRVAMGGAATFVAGTSRSVPVIGTTVDVIPCTPTQVTYRSLADSPAAYNVSIPSLDWSQQFTAAWPFQDVRQ